MCARPAGDLRNVAIIAHVDHGKTTLVDGMIRQSGLLRRNQELGECILDTHELERERGITILSKNIAVRFRGVKINLIDTPGHADFGGEVQRVLRMADGCLLLVDAFEGPMPQTRYVLGKALELGLRPVVVINKMDRAPDRGHEAVEEVFDLMVDLGADDDQLDFPAIFASGRSGWASRDPEEPGEDLTPLLETILSDVPAPRDPREGPSQLQVSTLDWSSYTGRIAIGRLHRGVLSAGQPVVVVKAGDRRERAVIKRLLLFEGMGREEAEEVRAGDLCAIEGLEEAAIGDTICAEERVEALPRIEVDAPTVSMVFQVNDGPFAGQDGRFVTSRHLRDRLHRETLKNVALRVEDTDRPEALKVSGRGVLHLGILVEEMRREGYEFCVGKPRVIFREEGGRTLEPVEAVTVEVAEKHAGRVIELLGRRRGEMESMEQRGDVVRIVHRCPARGLIGIRTRILNLTQGEAVFVHVFHGYEPHKGEVPSRGVGVMISTERGEAIVYALASLKDRGTFFVQPGERVYEGMIVGEHCKEGDIEVNVCRTKKLTNVRAAGSDRKLFLPPARVPGVEDALEYIEDDELVEVTPAAIRLRKVLLSEGERRRERRRLQDTRA